MIEREDIDALLVGALYGELDAAEQARLDAHLSAHPADKSALEDLKAVRGRVTSSRIFEVQAEPPQAISAMLLQEAARRAPAKPRVREEGEGWFARFVKSFVAHPAMAAAATLVLVVGVAGTIYLKNGNPSAADRMTASAPAEIQAKEAPATGASAGSASAMVAMGSANIPMEQKREELRAKQQQEDSVNVALDESAPGGKAKTPVADPTPAPAKAAVAHHAADRSGELAFGADNNTRKGGEASAIGGDAEKKLETKKPSSYVEVQGNRPAPKDLADKADDGTVVAQAPVAPTTTSSTMGLGGAAAPTSPPAVANATPPPPPPPPPEADRGAATSTKATKEAQPAEIAWAKDQHARVIALVKEGKCQDAAPIARAIRNRAPAYFNSYVATDRELKACMPYIQDTSTNAPKAAAQRADQAK